MRKRTYLALGCLLLAGCTTQADGTQSVNKTAVGATVGALAGGVLGNRLDKGNRTRGTIIGAAAGAAAGGGLGYMMDRQEADLREQLASERAQHAVEIQRVRDDLLKLTLANEVSFDVNSATVKPTFKPSLAKVAEVLKSYDSQMTVVGHTDSTGSESYNQQLSERRAEAVRAELIRDGVPAERLSAMGRGENEPRADNSTSAGRAQNRRVEILVQSTA
jgi:outer membrane protein OmpA-like peptidoglycan-associated protein